MSKTRTNTPKKKPAAKPGDSSLQPSATSEPLKGIVDFKYVDPEKILENPNNWREHGINQKRAIRASVEKFGYIKPLIVNRRTNRLIDGHARLEDARAKGAEAVPVVYVDMDEAEEAEALLVVDSIGSMATSNEEKVTTLASIIERNRKAISARVEPPEVSKTLRNLYASIRERAGKFASNPYSVRGQTAPEPIVPARKEEEEDDEEYEPFGDPLDPYDAEEGSGEDEEESDSLSDQIDRGLESLEGASEEEKRTLKAKFEERLRNLDHASVSQEKIELALSLVNAQFEFAEPTDLEVPALSEDVENPEHYVQAEDLPLRMTTWAGSGNPHPGPHAIYCISSSPYPIDRRGGYLFTHTNDSRFDHLWKDPALYALNMLEDGWKGVLEPEYSLFDGNPFWVNLNNLGKRRWLARYYQELGIPIIPIVSAFRNPYSDFLAIDSLPQGVPVISYQIRGLPKEAAAREKRIAYKMEILKYAVEDVEPKAVILYGAAEPKYWEMLAPKLPEGPRYIPTMAYASLRREGIKRKKKAART